MRIAVSTDNGQVSAHFGRCAEYTLADIEDNKVVKTEVIANPGHQPGFLPKFLAEKGASVIICGGAGPRAQALFAEQDIQMCMGISGPVAAVLEQYAAGTLQAGESTCNHESRGDGTHQHRY
jgi:predicted Fe-Mo cluster-binding NifX family protein